MQQSFPISEVVNAAQRKAQLEQQAQQQGNESLVQGLQSIGQIGASLAAQKQKVAQALALGKLIGVDPEVARSLDTSQIIEVAKLTKGYDDQAKYIDLLQKLYGMSQSPAASAQPQSPGVAAPASQPMAPSPAHQAGAILAHDVSGTPMPDPTMNGGGLTPPTTGAVPVPIQAPPLQASPKISPAVQKMIMRAAEAHRMQPVVTRAQAEKAGGVLPGTHILPDEKGQQDLLDPAYQGKLEKQYADMRLKALSNRSGGLGLQDSKVNQAFDLRKLVNKYYDPKTGNFNIPPSQHAELALGLARLISPTGQVGIDLLHELRQGTGREALSKALIYAGADPTQVGGPTQNVAKLFIDSIDRQGETAEQLRDQYMQYISDNAPTDLEPARKAKHDKGKLNSFNDFLSKSPDRQAAQGISLQPYSDPEKERKYQEYKRSHSL